MKTSSLELFWLFCTHKINTLTLKGLITIIDLLMCSMSEYKQVKIGKLKLKGQSSETRKKKHKKKRKLDDGNEQSVEDLNEVKQSSGWWMLKSFEHLNCGTVAIQSSVNNAYIFAVDNGTLTLGNSREGNDLIPVDEEIFTVIQISENKIALKSGYGEFIHTFNNTHFKVLKC